MFLFREKSIFYSNQYSYGENVLLRDHLITFSYIFEVTVSRLLTRQCVSGNIGWSFRYQRNFFKVYQKRRIFALTFTTVHFQIPINQGEAAINNGQERMESNQWVITIKFSIISP